MIDHKTKLILALNLHQSGNLEDAEKLYKEILAQNPEDANAVNLLSSLKISKNECQNFGPGVGAGGEASLFAAPPAQKGPLGGGRDAYKKLLLRAIRR